MSVPVDNELNLHPGYMFTLQDSCFSRVDRFNLFCELAFWIVWKSYLRSIQTTFVL
jgi:hypothetical protein